jgi:site-specific recombinase XerD
MRHSTAVALVKSRVDLSTISRWLGHANLETTNRYAVVDLDIKRSAIASVKPVPGPKTRTAPWRERTVVEWLASL